MVDLAALSDKYQINDIVLNFFRSTWLGKHKGDGKYWPTTTVCQDWALATLRFKLKEDSDYLFSLLALEVGYEDETPTLYYVDKRPECCS
jgi:hypothetical protein